MLFLARPVERLFVFVFLSIFLGFFWPPSRYFFNEVGQAGSSNPYDLWAFIILLPFMALGLFSLRGELPALLRAAWPALILCALAFLSAFWAADAGLVIRRSGTLTLTALFGVYLAGRSDFSGFVRLLVKVYAVAALTSLALVAFVPRLGTTIASEMYVNSWRGVLTDKNELGMACAVGIIVSLYAFATRQGPRWLSGLTAAACAALLVGAQSKTPLVVLVVALYAGLLGSALRRRSGASFATGFLLIVVGVIGAGILALGLDVVLGILGRDATLTNRAKIWRYAMVFIDHRPWLGSGFGAFWRADGLEANQFWVLVEFPTPHAHNAWLEIGLNLGILGMLTAAFAWLASLYRALRLLTLHSAGHAAFCLALLVGIFVENLTEYEFMRQGHLLWVLFATLTTYLGMELAAMQRRPARAAAPLPATAPAFRGFGAPPATINS